MLQHTSKLYPYIEEHKEHLRQVNPDRSKPWIAKEHMNGFNFWFKNRVQNSANSTNDDGIRCLAKGSLFTVTSYQWYDVNGYTFYTNAQYKKSTYQNSGVHIDAFDHNGQNAAYSGQIEKVWELNYVYFKLPIFMCRWVQGRKVVIKDKYGFTTVDLKKIGYMEEPFVLAKQVSQVFYVPDMTNKKLQVDQAESHKESAKICSKSLET